LAVKFSWKVSGGGEEGFPTTFLYDKGVNKELSKKSKIQELLVELPLKPDGAQYPNDVFATPLARV